VGSVLSIAVTIKIPGVQSSAAPRRCTLARLDCYLDYYGVVNFSLFPMAIGLRFRLPN